MKIKSTLSFLFVIAILTVFLVGCGIVGVTPIATSTAEATATSSSAASTPAAVTNSDGSQPMGTPPSNPGGVPPQGTAPAGSPGANPGGMPPQGGNMPGGTNDSSSYNFSGAYTVDGTTASQSGQSYTAANADESAVYVIHSGNLTLVNATITTSSVSSSSDASSFYGLNAGVLAASGGVIDISNSTVTTTGDGANGVFASGDGSQVTISNTTINCTGQYAHAVMATLGGKLLVTNVDMTTAGGSSGAIATDRGSGTIDVTGGTILTTGPNSPGIYSTGQITVNDANITASGSEAAVIEGGNTINLKGTLLTSTFENKWGVMIYQSMSGDAEGTQGTFTMEGGALSYTSTTGPLFYVNNSTAIITLKSVDISVGSGVLVNAAAGNWGTSGANGGTVILTAEGQELSGNLTADEISSITFILKNGSAWSGAINSAKTAKSISLTLDASSTWNVTADSYLTTFSDDAGISGATITNITGNGHTVFYDASASPSLGGKTFTLQGGGTLQPAN